MLHRVLRTRGAAKAARSSTQFVPSASFRTTQVARIFKVSDHSDLHAPLHKETWGRDESPYLSDEPPMVTGIKVTFVDASGIRYPVTGTEGQNLLEVAHNNDVPVPSFDQICRGGTGHPVYEYGTGPQSRLSAMIFPSGVLESLDEPTDPEADILGGIGFPENHRLGCQVTLKPELGGLVVGLPAYGEDPWIVSDPDGAPVRDGEGVDNYFSYLYKKTGGSQDGEEDIVAEAQAERLARLAAKAEQDEAIQNAQKRPEL